MELFIQMGHGMQTLALEHLDVFGGGTVIISPMNIQSNNLVRYAANVRKKNGKILFRSTIVLPTSLSEKFVNICILAAG